MTDWIEWHGGEQPVADDVVVETKSRGGFVNAQRAVLVDWCYWGGQLLSDIIAYRIVSQDSELDRLRAENARLREDAERFAWLALQGEFSAHSVPSDPHDYELHLLDWEPFPDGRTFKGNDLRSCIDAARAALGGQEHD